VEETRHPNWSDLGRAVLSNWKLFLYLTLLMMMMNFSSHGTQDSFPTFLQRQWGMKADAARRDYRDSMVGAICGGTLIGFLSDRFGRRRAMIAAFICAIAVVPLWAYAPSLTLLVVGAFLLQFMVQGAWGIIPAHLSELSPDGARILPDSLSVRRAAGGFGCIHRGDSRRAHELRERHGADCVRCIHAGSGGGGYGTREEGH